MSFEQHFQAALNIAIKEQQSSTISNPNRQVYNPSYQNVGIAVESTMPSHASRSTWTSHVQNNYRGVRSRGESSNHKETMQQLAKTYHANNSSEFVSNNH